MSDKSERVLQLKMREVSPAEAARLLRRVADDMEAARSSGGEIVESGKEMVAWLWDDLIWDGVEPRSNLQAPLDQNVHS